MRAFILPLVAGLLFTSSSLAQQPWRFKFEKGQVLQYKVEQTTLASDTVDGNTEKTQSELKLTKSWQVLDVDANGTATLQLSLTALRSKTVSPKGEELLFDSADLEKSTKELREGMVGFLNKPLVTLKIEPTGKVTEVKETKYGSATTYEAMPPFVFTLPVAEIKQGSTWERTFNVTLGPPHGTGEKFPAVQKATCLELQGEWAKLAVETTVTKLPEVLAEQTPLFQFMPKGQVLFNSNSGLLYQAVLSIEKKLENHHGEGSSYLFQSTYSEKFEPNK